MKKVVTDKARHATLALQPENRLFSEEEKPEWAIGPFTKHRFVVLILVCVLGVILYAIQIYLWPARREPVNILEHLWVMGHYLWLAGVPVATLMIVGIFMYRKEPLVNIPL